MPLFAIPIAITALGAVISTSRQTVTQNVTAAITPASENVAIESPEFNVSHIAIAAVLGVGALVAINKIKDL